MSGLVTRDSSLNEIVECVEASIRGELHLDLREHLASIEYILIKQALDEADGVIAHAAKRLMMGRTTLSEKVRKLGLFRDGDVVEL